MIYPNIAPLWDLFCKEFQSVECTYNTSVRKMIDIPRESHKYFIEPLNEETHIKKIVTSMTEYHLKLIKGTCGEAGWVNSLVLGQLVQLPNRSKSIRSKKRSIRSKKKSTRSK